MQFFRDHEQSIRNQIRDIANNPFAGFAYGFISIAINASPMGNTSKSIVQGITWTLCTVHMIYAFTNNEENRGIANMAFN